MSVQLNIFLLLFGGLQGLLVSLFLIRKKLLHSGYLFLLLYFAVMLLQITLKVMSKIWLMTHWEFFYGISYLLPFLYGPLIFLFVRRLLLRKKFHFGDIFHFLPFALFFLDDLLNGPLITIIPRIRYFYAHGLETSLQLISVVVYHLLALRSWYRHRSSLRNYYSETHRQQLQWVRQFIIGSGITCAVITVALFFLYKTYPRTTEFRFLFIILTVFIYWVSYAALTKPAVFSLIKGNAELNDDSFTPILTVHRPGRKYSNSGLSSNDIYSIRIAVEKLMDEQKPFLNPELTIQDLAILTNCSRHRLSQVLNESMKKSFYDYVNRCRIEEAKALLLDASRSGHKIASIAYDAGFNSLSTFNDVFRKSTGLTPSQFRKKGSVQSLEKRG